MVCNGALPFCFCNLRAWQQKTVISDQKMLKSALIIRLSEAEVNSLMAHSGKLYIQGCFFKDWNHSQDY
jgi:TATA-box binding protein (TBP) (component of TFIID and TFIIIB)